MVGLIILPEDYSTIVKLAFVEDVYKSQKEKRLIGIDAEVENPEEIINFGLIQKNFGKIVRKNNHLYLTQEEKLGASNVGMGLNILGNILLMFESFIEEVKEKILKKTKDI